MSNQSPPADLLLPVTFHEDTVVLADHGGEPFVVMKPMVESMGLDWKSQHVKLSEKFGSVMAMIATTGGDGKRYEMASLPLRKLAAWLYSINPNRVAPHLKDKIVRYQTECDEVLWQYWTQGYAARKGVKPPSISEQLSANKLMLKLLDALELETHPVKRRMVYAQLSHAAVLIGAPVPELASLGRDIDPDEAPWLSIMEQFSRELAAGRFKGPHRFEEHAGEAVLCVRTSDIMLHLSTAKDLRDFWRALPVKGDRVLKKLLQQAGVIVGEGERTIDERRVSRLSLMSLAELALQGVEVRHEGV